MKFFDFFYSSSDNDDGVVSKKGTPSFFCVLDLSYHQKKVSNFQEILDQMDETKCQRQNWLLECKICTSEELKKIKNNKEYLVFEMKAESKDAVSDAINTRNFSGLQKNVILISNGEKKEIEELKSDSSSMRLC